MKCFGQKSLRKHAGAVLNLWGLLTGAAPGHFSTSNPETRVRGWLSFKRRFDLGHHIAMCELSPKGSCGRR
eukprot:2787364-Amphidinium_carterae.1